MTKPCRKCGSIERNTQGQCAPCKAISLNKYLLDGEWKTKPCRVCGAIDRNDQGKCIPCKALSGKNWWLNNKAKAKVSNYKWQAKNKESVAASHKRYASGNKEVMLKRTREWFAKNPSVRLMHQRKREAAKLNAVPGWANEFYISEAYELAKLREKVCGGKWQVDHIVPLQSKLVCGLHTHDNLQVIPEATNRSKGNRTWPDMP